ncbi:MAG: regulatory protein RecX [Bacteroidota bacterium]
MSSTKSYTVTEATKKMERYCAYQERCHKEVRNKLVEMRMIPEAVDQIIGHLIQANFLNEERFARAFARGKFNQKSWGRNRIVRELAFREISKYNIQRALSEINEEAYQIKLSELARKKLDQISEKNTLKRKRKLADYLLYRGWEKHLVYDKIRELIG